MRDFKSFFLKRVPQKDRFLKGDKPTQEVFTRLFDSVGFIKEKTDRAKTDEQGFVKLVDDATAKSFTNPDTDYSYAVQPNQLPESKAKNLDGAISDMPLTTIDVLKDDGANPNHTTYFFRLKDTFLQWLITRLLPAGGTPTQVLKKASGTNYASVWDDNDKIQVISIVGDGIDYSYYNAPYYVGGSHFLNSGQGVLNLDINFNSYILQGNPDPRPSDFDSYGEYNIISMPGVKPGYRLKLKYTGNAANTVPLALFEYGVFAGNIDLGNFAVPIGNRRGLIVNKNDTLTFVYGTANKWILWETTAKKPKKRLHRYNRIHEFNPFSTGENLVTLFTTPNDGTKHAYNITISETFNLFGSNIWQYNTYTEIQTTSNAAAQNIGFTFGAIWVPAGSSPTDNQKSHGNRSVQQPIQNIDPNTPVRLKVDFDNARIHYYSITVNIEEIDLSEYQIFVTS